MYNVQYWSDRLRDQREMRAIAEWNGMELNGTERNVNGSSERKTCMNERGGEPSCHWSPRAASRSLSSPTRAAWSAARTRRSLHTRHSTAQCSITYSSTYYDNLISQNTYILAITWIIYVKVGLTWFRAAEHGYSNNIVQYLLTLHFSTVYVVYDCTVQSFELVHFFNERIK